MNRVIEIETEIKTEITNIIISLSARRASGVYNINLIRAAAIS